MIRINNVSLGLDSHEDNLLKKAARILGTSRESIKKLEIVKKAVDARNKKNVFFVYTLGVEIDYEEEYMGLRNVVAAPNIIYDVPNISNTANKTNSVRPIIIGAGPAGLFAALILAEAGLNPIIIERGYPVDKRFLHVEEFFKGGNLNPRSNVQFGEGGAGTFSDGKLTTGIKDFRIQRVMDELVAFGAPEEIKYLTKPHIGTDKLCTILINMRKKIESLGGEYWFNTQLVDITTKGGQLESIVLEDLVSGESRELDCGHLILAIGHSARDTFEMLKKKGLHMEAKSFSIGLRIEHKQNSINKAQYGKFWDHPKLGAADYKLSVNAEGRGVYTFCMCPGGQVVAAASEEGRLAVNGMSRYKRDLENANSAVLVSVSPMDFADFDGSDPLKGLYFQREIEARAFALGGKNYFAPVQLVGDFLTDKRSSAPGTVLPSYKPGYEFADLRECLPDFAVAPLKSAIKQMGKKLQNFDTYDAVLTAIESRSSSPVRIPRDITYESGILGLMPCGEGAGYAGGIMSSCVDGIRCAEALITMFNE